MATTTSRVKEDVLLAFATMQGALDLHAMIMDSVIARQTSLVCCVKSVRMVTTISPAEGLVCHATAALQAALALHVMIMDNANVGRTLMVGSVILVWRMHLAFQVVAARRVTVTLRVQSVEATHVML